MIRSPRERIVHHRAVARLEDVKRQKNVGEEDDVREREDGDRRWQHPSAWLSNYYHSGCLTPQRDDGIVVGCEVGCR